MAIELHHLHPGHDDEVARLKARIAELERMDTEHTVQIAKMNGYIHHLEEELEASKRKEKESRQPRKLQGDEMKTLTLSLKNPRSYTKRQEAYIKDAVRRRIPVKDMAFALQKSPKAVKGKIERMGLK